MTERWSGEPTEPSPGYGGYGNQPGAGDPTQGMPPPGRRPPGSGGPGSYDDERRRKTRRNWLIAAGVLAVVIIVVLIVLLLSSGGSSNNGVTISSFNVPSTVNCSGPTTIGASWSTTNATQVVLSVDGAPFKTYAGSSGADTIPFACNGASHSYTLTAKDASGAQATQTQTVTQISAPTTTPRSTTTTRGTTTTSSSTSTTSTSTTTTTSP